MSKKTITLDGIEYNLVPVEDEKDNTSTVTFYYACDSDCGFFQFNILLDDQGEIWEGTQSVTYYPDGQTNKNNSEYWDNPDFLREVLIDKKNAVKRNNNALFISNMPQITQHQEQNLVGLLQKVHKKGWL